jgi:hypothetical protein
MVDGIQIKINMANVREITHRLTGSDVIWDTTTWVELSEEEALRIASSLINQVVNKDPNTDRLEIPMKNNRFLTICVV